MHNMYGSASSAPALSTIPGADLAWLNNALIPDVLNARRRCLRSAASEYTPRGSVDAILSAISPATHSTVSSSSLCHRVPSHRYHPNPVTCR
ncbi:hypothetical protein GCM10010264_74940 [Streptomyces globisporus]|nr:hypothetical protein GCM10010264_74940 [Streptomyces globisporus]